MMDSQIDIGVLELNAIPNFWKLIACPVVEFIAASTRLSYGRL